MYMCVCVSLCACTNNIPRVVLKKKKCNENNFYPVMLTMVITSIYMLK